MPSGYYADVVSTAAVNTFTRKQLFRTGIADIVPGSEQLANAGPDFVDLADWTDDATGWGISGGKITHTPGSNGTLSQDITLSDDNVYILEISVSGMTAGWVDVYDNTSLDAYTEANGIIKAMGFVAAGSDTISISVSSDFDGQIDYISLKGSVDGTYPIGFPSNLILTDNNGSPICFLRTADGGGFIAGYAAGRFASGTIVAIGDNSLDAITTETGNVGLGPGSGRGAKCNNGLFVGPETGNGETRDGYAHIGINGDWISGQTASGDPASQSLKFHAQIIDMSDLPTSAGDSGTLWVDEANDGVIKRA